MKIADTHYSWVVWRADSIDWASPHLGMPFGAVASAVAWHKVGAILLLCILRLAKAPLSRYVDDFFGCSKEGVVWTGGKLLSILCTLTGFLCDPEKLKTMPCCWWC